MSNSTDAGNSADLQEAFPVVDPGAFPLGARVLKSATQWNHGQKVHGVRLVTSSAFRVGQVIVGK